MKLWEVCKCAYGNNFSGGNKVKEADQLTPRDSAFFKSKYNVEVKTSHEVLSVDPESKSLLVKDLLSQEVFTDYYDKLVLATGATASIPPMEGLPSEGVFTLRTIEDMNYIKSWMDTKHPKKAVIIGTGIFQLFGMTVALSGLSMREAVKEGYDVEICHNIKPNKPEYMGGKEMVIKAVADRDTGRLLGVQIVGYDGVDKRIDVFATAMTYQAKAEDLFHLDLAYAPPFSTTKDPVVYTGMILDNAMKQGRKLVTPETLSGWMEGKEEIQIVDARIPAQYEKDHVETAVNMPHSILREQIANLDPAKRTITYCNKGVTGNAAQNILLNHGFEEVYNLSGGHKNFVATESKKRRS